jgi:hypothetical protein
MAKYYVNKEAQSTGEHEVHKKGCQYFPSRHIYLGIFSSCQGAVKKAKEQYTNVDGCAYCSPSCHTR